MWPCGQQIFYLNVNKLWAKILPNIVCFFAHMFWLMWALSVLNNIVHDEQYSITIIIVYGTPMFYEPRRTYKKYNNCNKV